VTLFEQALDEPCPVLPGTLLGHLDVPATGQRLNLHEDFANPVANIFVVDQTRVPGRRSDRCMHLADKLFVRFVMQTTGRRGSRGNA